MQLTFGAFYKTSDNFEYFAKKELRSLENILAKIPKRNFKAK